MIQALHVVQTVLPVSLSCVEAYRMSGPTARQGSAGQAAWIVIRYSYCTWHAYQIIAIVLCCMVVGPTQLVW